jgi:hypothetical protein
MGRTSGSILMLFTINSWVIWKWVFFLSSGSSPTWVTGVPSETLEFSSTCRRFFNTRYGVDVLKLMQSIRQRVFKWGFLGCKPDKKNSFSCAHRVILHCIFRSFAVLFLFFYSLRVLVKRLTRTRRTDQLSPNISPRTGPALSSSSKFDPITLIRKHALFLSQKRSSR